ncbi:MAG: ABC transporter permease [Bryobacteraceae bacterium]|jgi:putative ABC transport system permease protein
MLSSLQVLRQDVQFALRQLRHRPGFAIVAIAVLALGLGGNAAMFSVVNAVLLQPLPYADPQRLVALFERDVVGEEPFNVVAPGNFLDWQKQARGFEEIAASGETAFNLASATGSFTPERIDGSFCSANLFATLGVTPAVGRTFRDEEDRPGAARVAVISFALWQHRFGGAPDIVHRQIRLDSELYNIVGVMPQSFGYPYRTVAAWVPIERYLDAGQLQSHGHHMLTVIGRLRPGVSVEQARTEIDGIARRFKQEHPEEITGKGGNAVPLSDHSPNYNVQAVRVSLLVLFGAVGCVLIIACVNVANLLLTRALGRQREVAIRSAVGATRARIVRQLLTESVTLSLLGGAGGLLLASLATDTLAARAPYAAYLPGIDRIGVDRPVFLFTFSVALLTGIAAGLFPAFQGSRSDIVESLKGRSVSTGRSHARFRDALVAGEVALSLVLLAGAGLLLRSFSRLQNVHTGVRTDHTLTMATDLPQASYKTRAEVAAFYRQLPDREQAVPGVQSAGLVTCAPVGGHCGDWVFLIEGRTLPPGKLMDALYRAADPGYFTAAGIPLLEGRTFTARDDAGFDDLHPRPDAAVVSESFAKRFFPGEAAIGKRIYLPGESATRKHPHFEIIGIVGDVVQRLDSAVQPTLYVPLLDGDFNEAFIVLHTSGDPHAVASAARHQIHALDRDLPVFEIRTMDEIIGLSARNREFSVLLLGLFAGLALGLAAVGLYGVLSYVVSQRTAEIGIRMALGAPSSEVRRLILMQGMKPALAGIAAGLMGAAFGTKLLSGLLFGVGAGDPLTFVSVPVVLLIVAAIACLIPAIRATRIDPTLALRRE